MKFLLSAGDYSADLHGENLVRELKKLNPDTEIVSLGGMKLKSVSTEFIEDLVLLDVSGFSKPIKEFFHLKNLLIQKIFPRLDRKEFSAVILIDYYGFNIHIAERARKNNIPVFYFVSPQVWASRQHRIQKIKKFIHKMLVIFPFEKELYEKHNVPVEFVGHPFIDRLNEIKNQHESESLNKSSLNQQIPNNNESIQLGLMPGSRPRELLRHIPIMLQTFAQLREKFPQLEASLIKVDFVPTAQYEKYIQQSLTPQIKKHLSACRLVSDPHYSIRLKQSLCLTASGSATLENALLGIPMVVVYQTSWVTYWIAKKIIRVPYISMPNILSQKKIVPELIQNDATVDNLVRTCSQYLKNKSDITEMKKNFERLRETLGPSGAYNRAAKIISDDVLAKQKIRF